MPFSRSALDSSTRSDAARTLPVDLVGVAVPGIEIGDEVDEQGRACPSRARPRAGRPMYWTARSHQRLATSVGCPSESQRTAAADGTACERRRRAAERSGRDAAPAAARGQRRDPRMRARAARVARGRGAAMMPDPRSGQAAPRKRGSAAALRRALLGGATLEGLVAQARSAAARRSAGVGTRGGLVREGPRRPCSLRWPDARGGVAECCRSVGLNRYDAAVGRRRRRCPTRAHTVRWMPGRRR